MTGGDVEAGLSLIGATVLGCLGLAYGTPLLRWGIALLLGV